MDLLWGITESANRQARGVLGGSGVSEPSSEIHVLVEELHWARRRDRITNPGID